VPADSRPLPPPVTEAWAWQMDAACRGTDSEVFFSACGEPARDRSHRVRAAKALCTRCPVTAQCLDHALRTKEPYGVWGGRSEGERAKILGLQSLRYPARIRPPATPTARPRPVTSPNGAGR